MSILSVGFNNFIPYNKISIILQIDSRPTKQLITKARDNDKLVDATKGNRTRTVIIMTDGYVVLSAIESRTIAKRFKEDFGH